MFSHENHKGTSKYRLKIIKQGGKTLDLEAVVQWSGIFNGDKAAGHPIPEEYTGPKTIRELTLKQ